MNMADPNLGYTSRRSSRRTSTNPFYNYLTPEIVPGALRNQPAGTRAACCGPIRSTATLRIDNVGNWRSRYQALQLRVQRTYAAGASVLFAYNYNQERNEAYFNDLSSTPTRSSGWDRTMRGIARPSLEPTIFPSAKAASSARTCIRC